MSSSGRELPTSVFVALGAVVLGLGGAWWTASAPPTGDAAPKTTAAAGRLDGTGRLDATGGAGFGKAAGWLALRPAAVGGGLRVDRPWETPTVGATIQLDMGTGKILRYRSDSGQPRSDHDAFQRMVTEMKQRRR